MESLRREMRAMNIEANETTFSVLITALFHLVWANAQQRLPDPDEAQDASDDEREIESPEGSPEGSPAVSSPKSPNLLDGSDDEAPKS